MAKAAIGLFETAAKAEHVYRELLDHGFTRGELRMITTPTVVTDGPSGLERPGEESASAMSGAGVGETAWLKIGGISHEDAALYLEGIRRGSAIVAVESPEADEAAEIMDRLGAIDVEKRSASWMENGWVRPMARAAGRGMSPPRGEGTVQTGRRRSAGGGARVFVW